MIRSHIVSDDGTVLQHIVCRSENPSGKTAFVTHTQAQHSLNLLKTIKGLANRGFDVHAVDLRGHGHSSGKKAPLGHMQIDKGWDLLVSDLRKAFEIAFEGTDWADRLIVAPNIGASLTLDILKTWPDLAKNIVLSSPPPSEPRLMRMGQAFTKARTLFHGEDNKDELTLQQLYRFLGLHLESQSSLIDVVSSDPEIVRELTSDPYAWPIPTTGYFHEMFRGIERGWTWDEGQSVRAGTRFLLLYGGEDPVSARGLFIEPMMRTLLEIGSDDVGAYCIPEGRGGLLIEEERFQISSLLAQWESGDLPIKTMSQMKAEFQVPEGQTGLHVVSSTMLERLGSAPRADIRSEDLVELCYTAIDSERHWTEALYQLAFEIAHSSEFDNDRVGDMLRQIMPHWQRAFMLSKQMMQNAVIGSILQDIIGRFGIGIGIFATDSNLLYGNPAFYQALERHFGGDGADPLRALGKCVLEQPKTDRRETLLVKGDESVGFFFHPPIMDKMGMEPSTGSGVVILIDRAEEAVASEDQKELLRLAYGLTDKEAETTLLVSRGLSPDRISDKLAVSVNTVRTHLKSVFEKMNVRSQSELVSRLLSGAFSLVLDGSPERT
ncbi:alpha/beta fold hydrolase [Henriciella litoralis]|uniref:alpha/beta fold hydrolase n=1 Tax=Henriciella litoralis TaxID=568102 RepID=UPI000A049FDA|nr:alpha/beta fold hydrolase [Henriciella litoralis]